MKTLLLPADDKSISYAAELLNKGQTVAIPTETVYGLAAIALNEAAVSRVFKAKGRPQDNPLIVHISSLEMISPLVLDIPAPAKKLAEAFWPGALTMIFKSSGLIPKSVTAKLDTVAIRFPSHEVAKRIIEETGMPLAAPSANSSGKPSPTTAAHVYNDLKGKIPAVIDGGECNVGIESTVVLLNDDSVTLLRPGGITVEMLSAFTDVTVAEGVLHEVSDGERPLSPGMKHKHYSPKTKIIMVEGDFEKFKAFVAEKSNQKYGVMVFDGEEKSFSVPSVVYGGKESAAAQANRLFSALRLVDDLNVKVVYARSPQKDGVGLAVYNRLIRAAGFEVITL